MFRLRVVALLSLFFIFAAVNFTSYSALFLQTSTNKNNNKNNQNLHQSENLPGIQVKIQHPNSVVHEINSDSDSDSDSDTVTLRNKSHRLNFLKNKKPPAKTKSAGDQDISKSKLAGNGGNASLKSFYAGKLEEGLLAWEEQKLWFYKTLIKQRQHSQFQCYVSRKHQFKVCTAPKVSSSVWKQVFCELNGRKRVRCYPGTIDWYESGLSRLVTKVDETKATIVRIIRDPLERLVSAYFDKCVSDNHRGSQKHCHPQELMLKKPTGYFLQPETFAAWVDMLGYDWDEHVLPQCVEAYFPKGTVPYAPQPYTHVIVMDGNYMKGIEKMLESVKLMTEEEKRSILAKFNQSLGSRVASSTLHKRYREFYTKSTAARALQYYAMDYKCLDLPLPQWLMTITS